MILLASSDQKIVARWERSLFGVSSLIISNTLSSLEEKLLSNKPSILLLDYDLLGKDSHKKIVTLLSMSKTTKIIVFAEILSDEIEWLLYKAGIKGCCRSDAEPEQIRQAIDMIRGGELWMRRTLTNYMLHELVKVTQEKNRIEQVTDELLVNLTRREHEIALLVGKGENNKKIANLLAITERTVKAHLTEIFRKLSITDRLKLALLIKDTTKALS